MISREDKINLINIRIMKINQSKDNFIQSNLDDASKGRDEIVSLVISKMDLEIQALTNALEML
jgi:hypothetical protein